MTPPPIGRTIEDRMYGPRPKHVPLYDANGDLLTADTQLPSMYKITASGAETVYFYLPKMCGEITNIRYMLDGAQTLDFKFQMKALGASNWQEFPGHSSGTLAADGTSQDFNGNYPLRELIPSDMELRVAITVGGACDVGCQVVYL